MENRMFSVQCAPPGWHCTGGQQTVTSAAVETGGGCRCCSLPPVQTAWHQGRTSGAGRAPEKPTLAIAA